MARPLRLEFPGAVCHLTSRGNARQDIMADDRDRSQLLTLLAHVVDRYGWLCHADCDRGANSGIIENRLLPMEK